MLSNFTIAQKGITIVLVPLVIVAVTCLSLSHQVDIAQQNVEKLQRSKQVLLELNKFETEVTRTILNLTNPANQDSRTINSEIAIARQYFQENRQWQNLGNLDSDLLEIVADFQSARATILNFVDKVEAIVNNPKIAVERRAKKIPTTLVAVIALNNQELSQRVVRVESKIKSAESNEIRRIKNETIVRVAACLLFAIATTALLGALAVKDILQRLRGISEKALLVSSGKQLFDSPIGRDEIAQLERTLHTASNTISATRRRENALLDNAADIILTLDEKLKIVEVSESCVRLWHYSQEELRGKSIISLLSENSVDRTIADLSWIESELGEGDLENSIKAKDGSFKTFAWSIRWHSEDKIFYCVAHDVTEKRALEKLKQQFTAMVSHDLRAPVTSIGLSLQLLLAGKRGDLSEAVNQTLTKADSTAGRLISLVNELLELDKLDAGKSNLNKELSSVYEICNAAKVDLETIADQAKVSIQGPIGDAAVFVDEGRITQAVKNLLSNAIKFSPQNSIVFISLERAKGEVEIRIKDQGPGIAEDEQELIFDKFQQSRSSKEIKTKGTGLGLAIAKGFVEAHSGTVGVESVPGEGSTFWIRLLEDTGEDACE